MLGDVAADLAAAQALVDRSVCDRLTAAAAAAAKLHATQVHARAVDVGVQLHGGYGYMLEYAIAGAFGNTRFLRLHAARGSSCPTRSPRRCLIEPRVDISTVVWKACANYLIRM
jgi:hypothetical protein